MKLYKIRNRETGEFSTGGNAVLVDEPWKPVWSKRGKVWRSLGDVRRHLALFSQPGKSASQRESVQAYLAVAEVVEYGYDAMEPVVVQP